MDELELLKKRWQAQESSLPNYKSTEIYEMLHKKSSSIVKWIFLISIFEFIFWFVIEFIGMSQSVNESLKELDLQTFYRVTLVVNYVVIIAFIIKFFFNYRQIQTTDTVKSLMKTIVKTRLTVKYYVWFNIIFFAITSIVSVVVTLNHLDNINSQSFWLSILISIAILGFIILIIWAFYRLLYGILTRRLLINYKNLKKIEL
ncbi:hypothetical protein SAMN05444278_10528 [Psychroflexus salarius]|uniref:Beta-carotene 15,15'-monooxygenase n=1 Tax=Psychroflexus salarius TaxID=1155689 RepID=A0A1M4W1W2_9FLAO|nr:hypothetical protein [Psychroflexus salarius]SHE75113.1 hypothetical protein SAMN05444278_10528 [Psychroflexus salarius]